MGAGSSQEWVRTFIGDNSLELNFLGGTFLGCNFKGGRERSEKGNFIWGTFIGGYFNKGQLSQVAIF